MDYSKLSWTELKRYRLSILAGLVIVLVIIVVHMLWISPVLADKQRIQEQVEQQNELISKYKERLNQAQSIRENLVRQEEDLKEMQKLLFRGHDPYQLAASLGDSLSKAGQKLDIKTYQVLQSKEYGLYQEVHLRFNFMTSIEGLHHFLEQVKTFQAAILVHEINIQKIQRKTGPDLVVNVILAALMEKGEKA
jgi:Tfp pilus assembly protein PilO